MAYVGEAAGWECDYSTHFEDAEPACFTAAGCTYGSGKWWQCGTYFGSGTELRSVAFYYVVPWGCKDGLHEDETYAGVICRNAFAGGKNGTG